MTRSAEQHSPSPRSSSINPRNQQPSHQEFIDGVPRYFTHEQKVLALERQGYVCPICGGSISASTGSCHHMVMWSQGGATKVTNLMVVHFGECHDYADRQARQHGDMIVGTIFQADESQVRNPSILERIKSMRRR